MVSLSDFLLARIAEDEALARAALNDAPSPWRAWGHGAGGEYMLEDAAAVCQFETGDGYAGWAPAAVVEHIARHDPARVLADCGAKRGLVETMAWGDGQGPAAEVIRSEGLAHLASPYSDHPEYRQEWKPIEGDDE